MSSRQQVFICYSHKDSAYFDEFRTMLAPLRQLDIWQDRRIGPGEDWREKIAQALQAAKVAVLLVSPDFLASSFIQSAELPAILRRQRDDGLVVVPVHLRPSLVSDTVLDTFQGANSPERPIASLKERADRDAEYKAIAEKLRDLLEPRAPSLPAAGGLAMAGDRRELLAGASFPGPGSAIGPLGVTPDLLPPSPVSLLRAGRRPQADFDALFDVVTDPAEVVRVIYGLGAPGAAAPGCAYLSGVREDPADFTVALAQQLHASPRGVLLCGRGGTGKSRESAELATDWCSRGWNIAVARGGPADLAMDELRALPHTLADARLLVVVDNLHVRGLSTPRDELPYVERLLAGLQSLRRLHAGDLRVLLISRSEPAHCVRLALDPEQPDWHGLKPLRLPEFSTAGLVRLLQALAADAGLTLDAEPARQLARRSDGRPSTMVINIARARQRGLPLDAEHWLPNEGDSWHDTITAIWQRHPGLGYVFEALDVLAEATVHARHASVVRLAARLGAGTAGAAAVNALVDAGLLGLREGVLRQFSDDLVRQGLTICGAQGAAHA